MTQGTDTFTMTGLVWNVPEPETRVAVASPEVVKAFEARCEEREAAIEHWDWNRIVVGAFDRFALLVAGDPVAMWCSYRSKPLRIEQRRLYRLDYLEVEPSRCGNALWGVFVLGLVARRAKELGADGLAVASIPARKDWYVRLGAQTIGKYQWKVEAGLIGLKIVDNALDELIKVTT